MILQITPIQASLIWEDAAANRKAFTSRIQQITAPTDIIVLPEMFTTGFTMHAKALAEPMQGPTLAWMQQIAAEKQACVTGSIIIQESKQYFNRLLWVTPDGGCQYYNKRHLFSLANEGEYYQAGTEQTVFLWKGWRIFPQICYDLRFPVWSRNTMDYSVYLNVANWPAQRAFAWQTLLRARAIENQCFVVGVNRIGIDGNGHSYQGDSVVLDPLGQPLAELADEAVNPTISLSYDLLSQTRARFPFLDDRDVFTLTND